MVTGSYQIYDRSELLLLTSPQVLGQPRRWRRGPKCFKELRARKEAWSSCHIPFHPAGSQHLQGAAVEQKMREAEGSFHSGNLRP